MCFQSSQHETLTNLVMDPSGTVAQALIVLITKVSWVYQFRSLSYKCYIPPLYFHNQSSITASETPTPHTPNTGPSVM